MNKLRIFLIGSGFAMVTIAAQPVFAQCYGCAIREDNPAWAYAYGGGYNTYAPSYDYNSYASPYGYNSYSYANPYGYNSNGYGSSYNTYDYYSGGAAAGSYGSGTGYSSGRGSSGYGGSTDSRYGDIVRNHARMIGAGRR